MSTVSGYLAGVRAHLDHAQECLREGNGKAVRIDTAAEVITRATRQLEKAQALVRAQARP